MQELPTEAAGWLGWERREGERRDAGGLMGRGGRKESGSRRARRVMLRDETPRGFIEQRRKKEERREKKAEREREREGEREKERKQSRKESTNERRRGAETCSALILKSTLVRLASSPRHRPCAFSFLSLFPLCDPTGAAAQRKSNRLRVMGMKIAPSAFRLPMLLSRGVSPWFPVPRLNASRKIIPSMFSTRASSFNQS